MTWNERKSSVEKRGSNEAQDLRWVGRGDGPGSRSGLTSLPGEDPITPRYRSQAFELSNWSAFFQQDMGRQSSEYGKRS